MAKVPTADEIASSFLERPMPIIGKPTRALLIPLRDIVHSNASQIKTTLGGGIYGYLGAMLEPAVYTALDNAAAFQIPEHPGNVLADELAGTQYAIADALRANKEKLRQYDEYNAVMQALRKQIIDTVEEKFIMSLRNKYTRYNSVHPKALLKYLFDTYGKITPEDVIENEKKFTEGWDGDEALRAERVKIHGSLWRVLWKRQLDKTLTPRRSIFWNHPAMLHHHAHWSSMSWMYCCHQLAPTAEPCRW
jgi:hypothetical protein